MTLSGLNLGFPRRSFTFAIIPGRLKSLHDHGRRVTLTEQRSCWESPVRTRLNACCRRLMRNRSGFQAGNSSPSARLICLDSTNLPPHHSAAVPAYRAAEYSIPFARGNTISGIFVHSKVMSDHGHMSVWSTYRFTGNSANTCVPKTSLHEAPQVPESTTLLDARYFPAVNGWISFLCYLAWFAIRENDHRLLFVAKQTIEVCNSAVGTCPMVDESPSCF
jgi:hypothetical protein